ncbi:hypothetical protein [Clostridium sp. ZS2-4]|uniref:hypothetical protein n=1 Tax=Clostridium sp. ZS2-4 TaxID=2987703 RepID=UPI00227B8DFC|nr:hypothetical protein [Clostridium sp. ZS2-4]MCY6353984.1 hypothetical protein [Clostridium sp. ZS2-4]
MEQLFGNKGILQLYVSTLDEIDSMNYRNKVYYNILYLWFKNKLNNKNIDSYFSENEIKTIAIYGVGNLGELLYDELKESNKIDVKYLIDQSNEDKNLYKVPIVKPEQVKSMEKVDCVVVTPIYAFDVIKKGLDKLEFKNIICIDDIIIKIHNE